MILRFIHSAFFCLFLFNTELIFSQSWNQTSSFPGTPRDDASYFKLGTKHYIGTGREVGFGCTRDFYSFDENTLTWNASASLPVGKERQYASSCSWNGKGYLFCGVDCSGTYLNDLWSYDPVTDSWTELNALPSGGRAGMVQFVLNDTMYCVGGKNASGILNEVWAYHFSNQTWIQKNNLPSDGIWRGIAFTFQNKGYIGLGKNNLNNQTGINSEILKYDSNLDSWSVVPNLNWGTRSYIGHTQTDSLLFLFGGLSETNQILVSTERIHLTDFTTDILADFPSIPRKGGVAFLVQNDLYYTTGVSTDTRFNETWKLSAVASIDELSTNQFDVFPNPATIEINIQGTKVIESVELLDVSGQVQSSNHVNSTKFTLTLDQFSSGYYFLKVLSEGTEQIEKVFISN
jgi:N-acetylneuraminic acid mutarotase